MAHIHIQGAGSVVALGQPAVDGEPHSVHTIELDCPPGSTRPKHLIAQVLRGTGLKWEGDVFTFFGLATFVFPETTCEQWDKVQAKTKPRITALYEAGVIRYGSW